MPWDSDTDNLQKHRRDFTRFARHLILGSLTRATALCLLFSACADPSASSSGAHETPQPMSDVARADRLCSADTPLPTRAETVALADAVAVLSAKAGATPEGAKLALTAANLRARLWRADRAVADAHEAHELYAAAANAFGPTVEGCDAALRDALFAGEVAGDAAVTYRQLFIAERVLTARGAPEACLDRVRTVRAATGAFRPEGDRLALLEKDAAAAAASAKIAAPGVGAPAAPSGAAGAPTPSNVPTPAVAGPNVAGDRQSLVVSPPDSAVAKGPAKLTSIERFGTEEGARVVLYASAPIAFDVGVLGSDEKAGKDARIYLDMKNTTAKGVSKEVEVGGALKRIRLGVQKTGTRVVFDLKGPLYRRIFYLPDPFRIVVDLSTRAPQSEEKPAVAGSSGRDIRRVALDPGHGGNDTGATGPTGLKEKDVTLDIAHRLAPILARELKVETLLTRDTDAYVALDLRTARANAFHADLFVSIHCNASETGTARGVQTFYLDASRERDSTLDKIAARENSTQKSKQEPGSSDSAELSAILTNLNVGQMAARSRHFADLLHRSALASLTPRYPDIKDQGVKSAGFFVLVGADMPAVLFETSFISNPDDEGRLATADYRQKMADAVFNAIKAYKEGK
ncbi:MAG: N-acetylmuramoyl-L-alanine amidase [Polyangiaceae bacterium]|nr:N-acetylmuramoyl-L-alanine amidase [Polyangiaceae bacterium]